MLSYSRHAIRSALGLVTALGAGVGSLVGCGREDIELAPPMESASGAGAEAGAGAGAEPTPGSRDASTPKVVDGGMAVPPPREAGPEPVEAGTKPPEPGFPEDCSPAIPQGLIAARPPMGWNGYNAFRCRAELDEAKLMATVDALIASGMQSAGYSYVNLDDCWQIGRDAEGVRLFDPERLSSSITSLVDRIHDRGLRFGFYSHIQDCRPSPGGEGYESIDAANYARWGVDYLKYVRCSANRFSQGAIEDLVDALKASGRDVVVSLATGGFQEWMHNLVQLWRVWDAEPTWDAVVKSIDAAVPLAAYARPGAFNDPDMLEIGNADFTAGEKRVQFSVWSILSAPLIAGNDLITMSEETRSILTNTDVIALNQDPLGLQAALVMSEGSVDVLAKPLAECGARAVVMWNRGDAAAEISLSWKDIWLVEGDEPAVHDLWQGQTLASQSDHLTVTVPPHDALALKVVGTEPALPRGQVYLSNLPWTYVTNGFGPVEIDSTNGEDEPLDGAEIRLRDTTYEKGLGVHGPSLIRYRLGRACSRFTADIGIDDDQATEGSVQFEVWADGELLFESGVVTGMSPAQTVDVDLRDKTELRLFVGIGGNTTALDHAVWAGARLDCAP